MAARAQRFGGRKMATTTSTMRAYRPRPPPVVVVASSKSAPPATTTVPRPPRPPATAPPPSSSPPATPPPGTREGDVGDVGGGGASPPPPPSHLVDPIAISASSTRSLVVGDRGRTSGVDGARGEEEDLSLDAYMRLPPSQYSALDPELIRRGGTAGGGGASDGGDPLVSASPLPPAAIFTLSVPRASMLGLWLEPVVSVRVEGATPDKRDVRLSSTACDLRGSSAVERLRINDVFALRFEAVLTWSPGGSITARVSTSVWADPVGPFKLVPRKAISSAGDALLRGLTAALLPQFLSKLGTDYERWASDPSHRRQREAMAREGGGAREPVAREGGGAREPVAREGGGAREKGEERVLDSSG